MFTPEGGVAPLLAVPSRPTWELPRGHGRRMPGHGVVGGGALRSTGVLLVLRPPSRWSAGRLLNQNRVAARMRVGVQRPGVSG